MDAVLASVAMAAATGSISASPNLEEETNFMERGASVASPSSGDFQVAAYQALLASLLSPCCHRPPYLAQGLAVFRNGTLVVIKTMPYIISLHPTLILTSTTPID